MTFEEIKLKVTKAIWELNSYANKGDVKRNRVHYGMILAYGEIIRLMGHKTALSNCWENDMGCLVISRATIDDEVLSI